MSLPAGGTVLYRPLLPADVARLAEFLGSLSPATRRFWDVESYDATTAREMCGAIARYDKFRMIALPDDGADAPVLALFEFAFHLGSDHERFRSYGIGLEEDLTCRFGPCERDSHQNSGLGSALMPATLELARRFGMRRLILWGGVLQENERAVHFYRKHGFDVAGQFKEPRGAACYDMFRDL